MQIHERKFSFKTISLAVLLTILLTSASCIVYLQIQASYTSTPVYLDALPSTASYVVEADGAGNYRKIKWDGSVVSSTNASQIGSWAIGNATGTVFWKAGVYDIYTKMPLKDNVEIEGEGEETVLWLKSITTSTIPYVIATSHTASSTTDSFAHGLSGTPTQVFIQQKTIGTYVIAVTSVNATHVTLTVSSSGSWEYY